MLNIIEVKELRGADLVDIPIHLVINLPSFLQLTPHRLLFRAVYLLIVDFDT
jgi:hypothetical protein